MDNDYPIDNTIPTQLVQHASGPMYVPAPQVEIISLILTDTGTFNEHVLRPYTTNSSADSIGQFIAKMQGALEKGAELTPSLISGDQSGFLTLSTHGENCRPIQNGWQTSRLRFLLKVLIRGVQGPDAVGYFQGYSEYSDMSYSGQIDPKMMFYINSFMIVSETPVNLPTGPAIMPRLIESSNIMDPLVTYGVPTTPTLTSAQTTGINMGFNYMRPNDVYSSIGVSHLESVHGGNVFDTRSEPTSFVRSWKVNNHPSNYLSRVVNTYVQQSASNRMNQNAAHYVKSTNNAGLDFLDQQGPGAILESCINLSEEKSLTDNAFLRMLSQAYGASYRAVTHFNLEMLQSMDPLLSKKVTYIKPQGSLSSGLPTAGASEYWTSQTRESIAAASIMNSVQSIMSELMLSKVSLISTNMTVDSAPTVNFLAVYSIAGIDTTPYLQLLKFRFINEIMAPITFQNQDAYQLSLNVDLFGDSRLDISLSGGPMTPYSQATFADSLFVPVVTGMPNVKTNLVRDMELALDSISEAIPIMLSRDNASNNVPAGMADPFNLGF